MSLRKIKQELLKATTWSVPRRIIWGFAALASVLTILNAAYALITMLRSNAADWIELIFELGQVPFWLAVLIGATFWHRLKR